MITDRGRQLREVGSSKKSCELWQLGAYVAVQVVSYEVRAHAHLRAVDLKSTPLTIGQTDCLARRFENPPRK